MYNQETRNFTFKIFNFMFNNFCVNYKNELFSKKIEEFIRIVLDGIENEKDPRNILITFKFIQLINKNIEEDLLKIYAKNFYDILEIYYPIEFTPPKNSPDKITPEMLIDELNDSFASNPYFMEYLSENLKGKNIYLYNYFREN
jgi:hypothetical protein